MTAENEGTAFGPVDESGVNFGRSGLTPEQESGFSPGNFAQQVVAQDERVTPGNLFSTPAPPPRSIPPMPGAVAPPPPPLNPVFNPVAGAAQPFQPAPPVAPAPVPQAPAAQPVPPTAHPIAQPVAQPTAQPVAQPVRPADPFAGAVPPPVAPVAAPLATPVAAAVAPAAAPAVAPAAAAGFTTTIQDPILPPAPPAKPRSRVRRLAPLIAAPLALVVAGGAFAAYQVGLFGAPGAQPSAVVPATAFAYASIDLNPSAEAKLGVYQFSKHFGSLDGVSKDSFKDELLADIAKDVPGLDYDKDLKPWLGDRAAVAVVPAPDTEEGVAPLVVVQYTDEEAAKTALDKAEKEARTSVNALTGTEVQEEFSDDAAAQVASTSTAASAETEPSAQDPFDYAFKDDYVLISTDAKALAAAVKSETSLDDNSVYAADRDRLGDDVLAHAWVDTTALIKALPEDAAADLPAEVRERLDGSAIIGATVKANYLDVTGHGRGYATVKTAAGSAYLDDLPGDATAAFAMTDLGPALTGLWDDMSETLNAFGVTGQEEGLNLPNDFNAVFGTDFAVAVEANQPAAKALVTSPDGERAVTVLDTLFAEEVGFPLDLDTTKDGYTATLNEWTAEQPLTENPDFTLAVPHATTARVVGYIDLAQVITLLEAEGVATDETPLAQWQNLTAAGFSATSDGKTASFTFRLTAGD